MDIFIDQGFRSLLSPLAPEELIELEASIINEGMRDSIVIWDKKNIIVDGHNRYDICTKHNIPIPDSKIIKKNLADEDEVKIWIIRNQFGRRNLDAWQRSKLVLKLEKIIGKKAKEHQKGGQGGILLQQISDEANTPIETNKELAKLAKVSHDTIAKVKVIEEKATPEQKAKLDAGETSINQVYVQVKKNEAVQKVLPMLALVVVASCYQ